MPHPTEDRRARRRGGRGWGWGVLVLGPLLLLAVLGVRGIQRSRESALEHARAASSAAVGQGVQFFHQGMRELRAKGALVAEFALVPEPLSEATEIEAQYEKALRGTPEEAEKVFAMILQDHPGATTGSGLPLAPLIEWARLQRCDDLKEIPARVARLGQVAVVERPSIISGKLLESAAAFVSERKGPDEALRKWLERWAEEENIRRVLPEIAEGKRRISQWVTAGGRHWWVEPETDGSWRVVRGEQMSDLAATAASKGAPSLPKGTRTSVAWAGKELLGEMKGERLARREDGQLVAVAILEDQAELFRDQRAQSMWLAALLGVALLAVLGGFVAMQRALNSERELNQQKGDFVSSVSHELRTPVSSMRLMLENLENNRVPTEDGKREYLRLLGSECRRLSALIENVLDFARIENDRKVYAMGETDVALMLQDTIQLLQPQATERRQKLVLKIEPMDQAPHLDALAIQQAVINLVENAMKFSPAETSITVTAGPRDAASWQLSVADEGPGIPVAEHARIFERFYRVGNELRRETQGAGIGLAIVKHTVQAHGGRIEVDSAPGHGSTFMLILPYHPEAAPTTPTT